MCSLPWRLPAPLHEILSHLKPPGIDPRSSLVRRYVCAIHASAAYCFKREQYHRKMRPPNTKTAQYNVLKHLYICNIVTSVNKVTVFGASYCAVCMFGGQSSAVLFPISRAPVSCRIVDHFIFYCFSWRLPVSSCATFLIHLRHFSAVKGFS